MRVQSGESQSLWMEVNLPQFASLEENLKVDVCIVGAGIAGLTCAYTLAKQGKTVAILDQMEVAGGQTARTTAHLTWALDDRFYEIERLFGEKACALSAKSHANAIDYIEQIVIDEKLDCDFERIDGYLFASPKDSVKTLERELNSIEKTGLDCQKSPAPFNFGFDIGPCLKFSRQGQFHPLKYINGLVAAILKLGGHFYTHTHVNGFKDGPTCEVTTEKGAKVFCKAIIVSTCTPVNNRFYIHTKQAAYRTYVIAAPIAKGSVPKGLYWDTEDPYHYVRTQRHLTDPSLEWLIVGGEDHKTGQDHPGMEKYAHLEKWTKKRFPMVKEISYRWSGQVFEPIDALGFIGKNPRDKNIYMATGDSGNGMTHGTIAGILIPALILNKKHPWKNLYRPARKTVAAGSEFIHENANALFQLKSWLTPGEKKNIQQMQKDQGIIIRKGLKKIAVYKDLEGKIHFNSAACPHLGGCLRWNNLEKSWDCPLHGSRFNGCGTVETGPAIHSLTPVE